MMHTLPYPALIVLLLQFMTCPCSSAQPVEKKSSIDHTTELKQAGYSSIPLTETNGLLYAKCKVGGLDVKMMLDTGSRYSIIDTKHTKALKLTLGQDVTVSGIGGPVSGHVVDLDHILIGEFDTLACSSAFVALALPMVQQRGDCDGILGAMNLDLLGAIIDYPARQMFLRKPIKSAWSKYAGKWSAIAWTDKGVVQPFKSDAAPTIEFADEQITITNNGISRTYLIDFFPGSEFGSFYLYDPKDAKKINDRYSAYGIIRFRDSAMTACFDFDRNSKKFPKEFVSNPSNKCTLVELKCTTDKRLAVTNGFDHLLVKQDYASIPMARQADSSWVVDGTFSKKAWPMQLDTGANGTLVDKDQMTAMGIPAQRIEKITGAGGVEVGSLYYLRGLTIGKHDTRKDWQFFETAGLSFAELNKSRKEQKLTEVRGILGTSELLNGSAIIDLGTNTLYLRPVKVSIQPKLAGTWVLKSSTSEDVRRVADGKETMTVTADRVAFKGGVKESEHGYHIKDEWSLYRMAIFDPKKDELADTFEYQDGLSLKLDGDKLSLVRVVDETKLKAAPTEFKAPKGSGLMLLEYTRKK